MTVGSDTYPGRVRRAGLPLPLVALLLLSAGGGGLQSASAQQWPAKPIRLVHGFLAGGNVDQNARLLGAPLGEFLGQQVLVDGRPGAGGTVATAQVAKAEPDGYTLFFAAAGHASAPALYKSLPYDAVRDFTFITLTTRNPYLVVIHPSFPGATIQKLVQMAKAEPGRLDFATGGVGTGMHLTSVLFQSSLGLKLNHVPYKGGQATPTAVATGEVPFMFGTPGEVQALMAAGKLKLIAVTSAQRWRARPEVPTLNETVLPGFDVSGWSVLIAPANLPPAIVARLNEGARAALQRPEIAERYRIGGTDVATTDPETARKFVAGEVARWTKSIREAGIPPQN